MTREPELKAYFEEAASWDADRAAIARRRACVAWWVAGTASVCALLSVSTLFVVMPLKTTEPFLVRVDSRTGIIDSVPRLSDAAKWMRSSRGIC
ncbi:MAG: VirB8/TrbF family protein [Gammaproteobacteria bacterium]